MRRDFFFEALTSLTFIKHHMPWQELLPPPANRCLVGKKLILHLLEESWCSDGVMTVSSSENNTLPIRHPKVIFGNLGTLMICLGLGKMKPFPPQPFPTVPMRVNSKLRCPMCHPYSHAASVTVKKEPLWVPGTPQAWTRLRRRAAGSLKSLRFVILLPKTAFFPNKDLHFHQKWESWASFLEESQRICAIITLPFLA